MNHTQPLDILDAKSAREGYERAIDKMEAKMEAMKDIPDWGVGLIVGFSIVALACCLQLLLITITIPCWWGRDCAEWDPSDVLYCWRRHRLRDEKPEPELELGDAAFEPDSKRDGEGTSGTSGTSGASGASDTSRKNGKRPISYDMEE